MDITSPVLVSILGNRSAAISLLYLQQFGEGYASHIADTFAVSAMGIQRQLKRLEAGDVLTSRLIGRTRLYTFNDSSPTVSCLRVLLQSELTRLPEIFATQGQ